MPGSWSQRTEQRALGAGICSSSLQLNLSLSTFALICLSGQETQLFALYFIRWPAAQVVESLLGPKEKRGLDLPWEVFEPQGCRKTSTTATYCSHPFHSQYCQDAKNIRRFLFFFLDCQDRIILNISCSLMAILEFTAQALSHFLFHPRLSAGGEELASQVICPWSLARQDNVGGQVAQSRATTHLLALEGRSSCGQQSSLLFRTETCLLWHWWHTVGVVFTIRTCTDILLCECPQRVQNQIKSTV